MQINHFKSLKDTRVITRKVVFLFVFFLKVRQFRMSQMTLTTSISILLYLHTHCRVGIRGERVTCCHVASVAGRRGGGRECDSPSLSALLFPLVFPLRTPATQASCHGSGLTTVTP